MANGRNVLADLEAIAAMPGIERMGEALAPAAGRSTGEAIVMFLAGQWAAGSRSELTSLLRHNDGWDLMRASAERVGRQLPEKAPTHDQLRHLRDRGAGTLGTALAAALPHAMEPLVDAVGLLPPAKDRNLQDPDRRNVLYGDGTVFKPLSDATVDVETGEIPARVAARYYGKLGKEGDRGSAGLPISLVGAHGYPRWQRVILGVDLYFDRNEIGSSMRLIDNALDVYGERIHAVVYDKLMSGTHQQHLMRRGVVPVVGLPGAHPGTRHVAVPAALQAKLGTRSKPKTHAVAQPLETIVHDVYGETCAHQLWALDGVVVACPPERPIPSFDDPVATLTRLWFEADPRRQRDQRLMAEYRLPCHGRPVHHVINVAGDRLSPSGTTAALADWLRPIPITGQYRTVNGFRQDVESMFWTMKRRAPHDKRAVSLDADNFLLDIVGVALHTNAVAWDVHGPGHTACGRACARTPAARRTRESVEKKSRSDRR